MLWVESYDKPFTLCFSPGLSSVVDLFPFLILALFYHPLLLFPHPFQFLCLGFIKNLFVFFIYSALSNLLCETPPLSGSKMKSWAHSAFCWDINQMESLVFSEMVKDSFRPRGFFFFFVPVFCFSRLLFITWTLSRHDKSFPQCVPPSGESSTLCLRRQQASS